MPMILSPQSRKWAYKSFQKFPCALGNPFLLPLPGLSAPHSQFRELSDPLALPVPKHWPRNVYKTEIRMSSVLFMTDLEISLLVLHPLATAVLVWCLISWTLLFYLFRLFCYCCYYFRWELKHSPYLACPEDHAFIFN